MGRFVVPRTRAWPEGRQTTRHLTPSDDSRATMPEMSLGFLLLNSNCPSRRSFHRCP